MSQSNLKNNEDRSGLYGYLAFYQNKKYEVWTSKGQYDAQNIACEYFKLPKNKGFKITIILCVKANNEVAVNIADF